MKSDEQLEMMVEWWWWVVWLSWESNRSLFTRGKHNVSDAFVYQNRPMFGLKEHLEKTVKIYFYSIKL